LTFNFAPRGLRFAKLRRRILQLPLQQRHLLSRDLILLSPLGELRVEIAIVGVELAGAAIQLRKLSLVRLLLPRLLPCRRGAGRGERIVVAAKLPDGDRHPKQPAAHRSAHRDSFAIQNAGMLAIAPHSRKSDLRASDAPTGAIAGKTTCRL